MNDTTKGRKSSASLTISFERIQVSHGAGTSHQHFFTNVGSQRIWTIGLSSSGGAGLAFFCIFNLIAHLISRLYR